MFYAFNWYDMAMDDIAAGIRWNYEWLQRKTNVLG